MESSKKQKRVFQYRKVLRNTLLPVTILKKLFFNFLFNRKKYPGHEVSTK